ADAIAMSGTIAYFAEPLRYSIEGISPTSIRPLWSRVAQLDGTSNRTAKPAAVSPCTSGRALRYSTAPRRTIFMPAGESGRTARLAPPHRDPPPGCSAGSLQPAIDARP